MGRRFLSGLLQLAIFLPLLLGSCVAPGVLYVKSARWVVGPVEGKPPPTFFIAFRRAGDATFDVAPLRLHQRKRPPGVEYRLPPGKHERALETMAELEATDEADGSQRVRLFVMGDTPWSSVSEYRVRDGRIEPLRHGHSSGWVFLAGFVVCIALLVLVMPPIRRRIERLVGIEPPSGPAR